MLATFRLMRQMGVFMTSLVLSFITLAIIFVYWPYVFEWQQIHASYMREALVEAVRTNWNTASGVQLTQFLKFTGKDGFTLLIAFWAMIWRLILAMVVRS